MQNLRHACEEISKRYTKKFGATMPPNNFRGGTHICLFPRLQL